MRGIRVMKGYLREPVMQLLATQEEEMAGQLRHKELSNQKLYDQGIKIAENESRSKHNHSIFFWKQNIG